MSEIQSLVVVVGAQLVALLGMVFYLSRLINASEARQITERQESERRLTDLIMAVEGRSKTQLEESERRLTDLYHEVNRDTKTLIGEVGFLRGSLRVPPRERESDSDSAAEAAD